MPAHTSPALIFPTPTTPTCPTSTTPTIKIPTVICPDIYDIATLIREYHDSQEAYIEEGQGKDRTQAIIDSLKAQEEHQDLEVQQLDIQYQHLKEQREVCEKAISILRDYVSSIECEIETTIRSQERAKAKAQKHRMRRISKLQDRRRDRIDETLHRDLSRYGSLVNDIIDIVDNSPCYTEVRSSTQGERRTEGQSS